MLAQVEPLSEAWTSQSGQILGLSVPPGAPSPHPSAAPHQNRKFSNIDQSPFVVRDNMVTSSHAGLCCIPINVSTGLMTTFCSCLHFHSATSTAASQLLDDACSGHTAVVFMTSPPEPPFSHSVVSHQFSGPWDCVSAFPWHAPGLWTTEESYACSFSIQHAS